MSSGPNHGMGPRPKVLESEEAQTLTAREKLFVKVRNEPFVPIGLLGTAAALVWGVAAYRRRGPMSTSRYLMRLRVIAQAAVVGAMVIGAGLGAGSSSSSSRSNRSSS